MTPFTLLICVFIYFGVLLAISFWTTRRIKSSSYFNADKGSKWYVVAFGMLGDSLSGVTFISVPGAVIFTKFGYFQIVLGYFVGYLAIITILLPLYYKLNLVSIYGYLRHRYGRFAQYTGSFFFMLSRILGSAARLFLAASVLQLFIFDQWGVPFALSVSLIIFLIWLYTTKGGIKTLVWTDAFQSSLLIFGVLVSIYVIVTQLNISWVDLPELIAENKNSELFCWDINSKNYFWKQFIGGAFIAACMTGLDQNMMQKNLTCKTLGESKKNIFWFSIVMLFTNLFFISLGLLLYTYAENLGIQLPMKPDGSIDSDKVFPFLAFNHLGFIASISFIVGLTAATFSSADSVLTTLTTSFYIDILGKDAEKNPDTKLRNLIHLSFALLLLLAILIIKILNASAVIDIVLKIANYTYGPLLGLFIFGLVTKRKLYDALVPLICITAPLIAYYIDAAPIILNGRPFQFGNTILIINGFITVLGLAFFSFFYKNKVS
ncbi:MAG: sodium:solute symporter [Chitinophagales bacterium]|nr:sodium:solute symporter [Chitinophagales bacterium]